MADTPIMPWERWRRAGALRLRPGEAARSTAPRERLLAVRDTATAASLAEVLAGDDPTEVADLLADAAEGADGTGRPLFSGLRGHGRPGDPFQRLWWACDLVREHRGVPPGAGVHRVREAPSVRKRRVTRRHR
jgi:hypothetical protein